jgi:hypothetical protein
MQLYCTFYCIGAVQFLNPMRHLLYTAYITEYMQLQYDQKHKLH